MPVAFLTDAERERLARFPTEVPPEDVIAYFTLSAADLRRVRQQRGAQNRLGFAVQLCALRYLGFIPGLASAPDALVAVVARQLGVQRSHLAGYGAREQTRTEHGQAIQEHLGFRNPNAGDLGTLRTWLLERALEHDRPTLLLQLACDRLRDQKLVRPGVSRVERLVASVRARGERETYQRLGSLLTEQRRALLDRMLVRDDRTGRTPLSWLRQGATANNASAILEGIEKLSFLRRCEVDAWSLEHLNPNRLKFLAQVGRRSTNQALARMAAAVRYPILVAFMRQQLVEIGDEVVDLFDRAMAQAYSRAGRELDEFRRRHARSTSEKVLLFRELATILLDSMGPPPNLWVESDELGWRPDRTLALARPSPCAAA
jgi:TnpA family transposase